MFYSLKRRKRSAENDLVSECVGWAGCFKCKNKNASRIACEFVFVFFTSSNSCYLYTLLEIQMKCGDSWEQYDLFCDARACLYVCITLALATPTMSLLAIHSKRLAHSYATHKTINFSFFLFIAISWLGRAFVFACYNIIYLYLHRSIYEQIPNYMAFQIFPHQVRMKCARSRRGECIHLNVWWFIRCFALMTIVIETVLMMMMKMMLLLPWPRRRRHHRWCRHVCHNHVYFGYIEKFPGLLRVFWSV